jgi:Fe-S oxidoreductase
MRRWVDHGVPIIGLEPSCLYTLRDEYPALLPETRPLAEQVMLFEEFLDAERRAGRFAPAFKAIPGDALLHGHCTRRRSPGWARCRACSVSCRACACR